MLDRVFVGQRVSELDTPAKPIKISRVTLKVDSETSYTAGDDSGRTLEKTCLWGSQAMANAVLAAVNSAGYQPFTGEDSLLDPAAEVGDGITIGGVYSVLAKTDITFDGLYTADASAPGSDELEDEYPYKSRARRQAERELSQTYSRITKTAEQIRLEVANDLRGLSSSIDIRLTSITQLVEDKTNGLRSEFKISLDGISSRVSNAEGDISTLEQTAKSLRTSITNAQGDISTLEQTANRLSTRISNVSGDVSSLEQTVDSFELSVSNGETSSTISLWKDGINVSSKTIRFTGTVTFDDLWGNQTIINGSTIDTETLFLDSLYGDEIYLRDYNGRIAASFETTGSSSTNKQALAIWSGAIRMQTYTGDIFIRAIDAGIQLDGDDYVEVGTDLYPKAANRYSCGLRSFPWSDVYSTDGTISSSDRNGKFDIDYDMSRYSSLFDALRPCSFRRTDGNQFRAHTGLIAQDVAGARDAAGLPDSELAAFCAWEEGCGLRYEEFIALLIYEVQQIKKQLKGETV